MSISKAWDWKQGDSPVWHSPSEESYYIAERWEEMRFHDPLDFGCGLGRHSIFFAKKGFRVSAFDLSQDAVDTLAACAADERLKIDARTCDMLDLPYAENSFDCIYAYHVISHIDSNGMAAILAEIRKILRPGGEIFLSLCSKETWSFRDAGYPKIDGNTVIKTCEGPENGIPHFYVSLDDIPELFTGFELVRIRHVDDCWFEGKKRNSKHYFILSKRMEE